MPASVSRFEGHLEFKASLGYEGPMSIITIVVVVVERSLLVSRERSEAGAWRDGSAAQRLPASMMT